MANHGLFLGRVAQSDMENHKNAYLLHGNVSVYAVDCIGLLWYVTMRQKKYKSYIGARLGIYNHHNVM